MVRRRLATALMGICCAFLGVLTSRCDNIGPASVVPPFDLCCWCLSTHSTPRGARCARGSVTDCIQDLERLDIGGSETNIRCIRDVCGRECGFLAPLLPKAAATQDCCSCLAGNRQDGQACYPGSTDECVTEIEEGELNKLLQGGNCPRTVCMEQCKALFGAGDAPDAGDEPDAAVPGDGGMGSSSSSSSGGMQPREDAGPGPHLPWDGGCPLNFPCF